MRWNSGSASSKRIIGACRRLSQTAHSFVGGDCSGAIAPAVGGGFGGGGAPPQNPPPPGAPAAGGVGAGGGFFGGGAPPPTKPPPRQAPRGGMRIGSGPDAVAAEPPEAVIEKLGTSATRRKPARIAGKHGAELNRQVLHRRRAPHRAGHECRTNILPMAAFVYAAFATTGRASCGLAVSGASAARCAAQEF